MTFSLTLPAAATTSPKTPRPSPFGWLTGVIARIGAHARLSRLSDRHLRDIGLTRGDIDGLRGHGSSQDAMTRLSIRAGQRADNW